MGLVLYNISYIQQVTVIIYLNVTQKAFCKMLCLGISQY